MFSVRLKHADEPAQSSGRDQKRNIAKKRTKPKNAYCIWCGPNPTPWRQSAPDLQMWNRVR